MFEVNPRVVALYVVGFLTAVGGSLVLTYVVRRFAHRHGLYDDVDDRKIHTRQIPRIGGVAIFLTVMLALGLLWAITGLVHWDEAERLSIVLAGATATHLLGLWDDLRPMSARLKFVVQILIALAVFAAGVRVNLLSVPLQAGEAWQLSTALSAVVTVIWFVGITNAFNLIDGLDGLASGAALFALTTMFVVASIYGQTGAALVTLVVAGAVLGFLFFNFHPASIFLGDSGSLFIGFMLAGIGLLSSQKSSTIVALAIPLVSLGLPVLDTGVAICRRFLRGKPIFSPDRQHIHHRLLSFGYSPRKVALLLYGACALLALSAMLLVRSGASYIAVVMIVVGLGVGLAVQRLRFHEFEELGRLVRKGMRQRDVIGRAVRAREATVQMAGVNDLDEIFRVLERTFAQDQFARSEVRLRRTFLAPGVAGSARRGDDEFAIWTWNRPASPASDTWEIRLPLRGADDVRMGSLVLWLTAQASDTALSHFHTIAGALRAQVERKIRDLWRVEEASDVEVAIPAPLGGLADMPAMAGRADALDGGQAGRLDPVVGREPRGTPEHLRAG